MSKTQIDAYSDTEKVKSDAFGLIDRDNRNHRKKQDVIIARSRAGGGDPVLEVGCGSGVHAPRYADLFDYTGIDLSSSLCQATRERLARQGLDGNIYQMDANNLSFPPESFQAVVGTAVLHHMPDPQVALREWQRVACTGGSITLMEPNYLFPKEIIETHWLPEERHKVNMRPWRLKRILGDLDGVSWSFAPRLYTPPWPGSAHGVFDRIDTALSMIPGVRWAGMMLLIHGVVE